MRTSSILTPALALSFVHCSGSTPSAAVPDASPADASTVDTSVSDAGNEATLDEGGDANPDGSCPPAPADGGMNSYGPDDPNVQYSGRVDFADPKQPKFAASAVYVGAKFHGSSVKVSFKDTSNFFDVIVDDLPPVRVAPAAGTSTYDATPSGLCDGVHHVKFVKRTEADVGSTTFLGFTFNGPILPPDPAPQPKRRIEIIGDSITCGSGVEATSSTAPECMQNGLFTMSSTGVITPQFGYGQGVENGYLAYGPVIARQLNAEWHVTCTSGIGLLRNYYNRDNRTMQVLYDLMYPENTASTPTWDTTLFVPDVIVIGLGTNDFSRATADPNTLRPPMTITGVDGGVGLVQGYIQFIDQLVTFYPGVTIVLVSSPILGDAYPTPSDTQFTDHQTAIKDVVAYYAPDGGAAAADGGAVNVRVYPAFLDKVFGLGCGGHPNVKEQAAAATKIVPVIQAAMNW
jgi:lysophospholipase L1-like esterase